MNDEPKIYDIMTFKQFIENMAGSGIIYESECRNILQDWKNADWIKVDEYIAPIVSELLVDAANTNRALYENIMTCVMDAYPVLKKELGFKPSIIRIK